jgi:hypothetical protein
VEGVGDPYRRRGTLTMLFFGVLVGFSSFWGRTRTRTVLVISLIFGGSIFAVSAILVVILSVRAPHIPDCDDLQDREEVEDSAKKNRSRSA